MSLAERVGQSRKRGHSCAGPRTGGLNMNGTTINEIQYLPFYKNVTDCPFIWTSQCLRCNPPHSAPCLQLYRRRHSADVFLGLHTNSMEQGSSWEADSSSLSQEIPFPPFHGNRRFTAVYITARHLSVFWAIWIQSAISLSIYLTLTLLTWKIWWAPNKASRWEMGFNSEFKRSRSVLILPSHLRLGLHNNIYIYIYIYIVGRVAQSV